MPGGDVEVISSVGVDVDVDVGVASALDSRDNYTAFLHGNSQTNKRNLILSQQQFQRIGQAMTVVPQGPLPSVEIPAWAAAPSRQELVEAANSPSRAGAGAGPRSRKPQAQARTQKQAQPEQIELQPGLNKYATTTTTTTIVTPATTLHIHVNRQQVPWHDSASNEHKEMDGAGSRSGSGSGSASGGSSDSGSSSESEIGSRGKSYGEERRTTAAADVTHHTRDAVDDEDEDEDDSGSDATDTAGVYYSGVGNPTWARGSPQPATSSGVLHPSADGAGAGAGAGGLFPSPKPRSNKSVPRPASATASPSPTPTSRRSASPTTPRALVKPQLW